MLKELNRLRGFTLHAKDGKIGTADEVLFDDEHWTVRYLIVDTGNWISHRKVLISPLAFGELNWDHHSLNVNLARVQIQNSPGVDTAEPISRQWEIEHYDYHEWSYYWSGMSAAQLAEVADKSDTPRQRAYHWAREHPDSHLRSSKEVTGYGITATDGDLGIVRDFIVDPEGWQIRYLVVDTNGWWPGRNVLIAKDWIDHIVWENRIVKVNVSRDIVRKAPEWDHQHSAVQGM